MASYEKKRKRILKRLFVAISLFFTSFSLLSLIHLFFGEKVPLLAEADPLIWILLTTALTALVYQPIDQAYAWLFKRVLFPRRSRLLIHLNRLSQELTQTHDLAELANLLVNTLGEVLQLKTVSLLIRAPRGEGYVIVSAYGWSLSDYRKIRLQASSPVLQLLKAMGPGVLLQERSVRSLSWQEANQLTHDFEALHATCVIPLWSRRELVGSINFLAPSQERLFDEGDLRFFKDFGCEVAPSVATALAIQELKLWNEELRDTQSQLLQTAKLTAIEQLATGIAHEIHNPLTIISGKAQVLLLQKDRKVYDEKVEDLLKTIVKQTRRAADITKKLLMFSRTSASPREKLRLEGVLEDTISLIAYQTSLEGIEIQRLVGQDLPDFFGNVQELREVFLNLVLNALQAIGLRSSGVVATGPFGPMARRDPEGAGGRIQVGITFDKADKTFVIQVADNGPGIAPENLDKVFNPFFTTRSEETGLGLFVTQQIVHRYGGSIRAESAQGEGTLFVVELPWVPAPEHNPSTGAVQEHKGDEVRDTAAGRR